MQIYVDNYLFLKALLHVSMFIHHPQASENHKINKIETIIQVAITEN